jgi:SAM-dependent methyltransferase
VLTVDFRKLGLRTGDRLLDLGCGGGRHAFEAFRLGARVVALDASAEELSKVRDTVGAMVVAGQVPCREGAAAVQGDALDLPFEDSSFDRVVAAEVLEHIPDDTGAMHELARVLRPGGTIAVTVPRFGPEAVNWSLSREYHEVEGGHVRIYRRSELGRRLRAAGLEPLGSHHAHSLHSPYWWLRCAVGPHNDDNTFVRAYHRVLVWDITSRPRVTRVAERVLNPVLGKSLVVYLRKRPAGAVVTGLPSRSGDHVPTLGRSA